MGRLAPLFANIEEERAIGLGVTVTGSHPSMKPTIPPRGTCEGVRIEKSGCVELLQQLADDPADRVICRSHAEQDLHGAAILLGKPASQTILGGQVASSEWFEQRQGRLRVEA